MRSLATICSEYLLLGVKIIVLSWIFFGAQVVFVAAAESVSLFDVAYEIRPDGTVLVTETITYDFAENNRRGIYRIIETDTEESASAWYKERKVLFELQAVLHNRSSAPYKEEGSRNRTIRIGDPDRTITGQHEYTISYILDGALTYFDDESAEFYWNVTGNKWEVPINEVQVRVSGVDIDAASCYVRTNSGNQVCEAVVEEQAVVMTYLDGVTPGGELTIAAAMPTGVVAVRQHESFNDWLFVIPLLIVSFAWALISGLQYRFLHHQRRPIIAEYEPYQNIRPMYAGALIDDSLDARDISAGILYLAQQGFFKITKTDKKIIWKITTTDYTVTLLRPLSEIDSQFLQSVSKLLFTNNSNVGSEIALSSIRSASNSSKQERMKTLTALRTALRNDLVAQGYFEMSNTSAAVFLKLFIVPSLVAIPLIYFELYPWVVAVFGLELIGFIAIVLRWRRRTKLGYEAQYHLKGFRHFLSVTDKERFDFHNAPERSPEQFMQYLPYAVSFGVEEKWAALFADMNITNPDWYEDSSATAAAFAATSLTRDLSAIASSVTNATQSASSGGGSAGGGGGGGGGGSW